MNLPQATASETTYMVPALRSNGSRPEETWRVARIISSENELIDKNSDDIIRAVNDLFPAVKTEIDLDENGHLIVSPEPGIIENAARLERIEITLTIGVHKKRSAGE